MTLVGRQLSRWVWLAVVFAVACGPKPQARWVAYVSGAGPGVGVYRFDPERGTLQEQSVTVSPGSSPTFLAVDAKKRRVYAANESAAGGVEAFSIGPYGDLTQLNEVLTAGEGPTHVALDATGQWLLSANYATGEVAAFGLRASGAFTGAYTAARAGVYAHQAVPMAHGALIVPCLGDHKLALFNLDADTGKLTRPQPAALPTADGGPRHLAVHPNEQWFYLAYELSSSVQLWVHSGDKLMPKGAPVSTLMQPTADNTAAEVQVHPNGRYVYVSNRGDDSIAVFALGADGTPKLTKTVKTGGAVPRHFSFDASGHWLLVANQGTGIGTGMVTVLEVVDEGGDLRPTRQHVAFPAPEFVQVQKLY